MGYEETYCDARIDRIDHFTGVLGPPTGMSELIELTALTIFQGSHVEVYGESNHEVYKVSERVVLNTKENR